MVVERRFENVMPEVLGGGPGGDLGLVERERRSEERRETQGGAVAVLREGVSIRGVHFPLRGHVARLPTPEIRPDSQL